MNNPIDKVYISLIKETLQKISTSLSKAGLNISDKDLLEVISNVEKANYLINQIGE